MFIMAEYLLVDYVWRSFLILSSCAVYVRSNLVMDQNLLWPRRMIPFEFGATLSNLQQTQLTQLFFQFHAQTCVRFVEHNEERDFIVFEVGTFKTLLPALGRRPGRQSLMFRPEDYDNNRVILRDLMRTVGFYYEVQRPDRFMFVTVNQSNIQTKAWGLFEKADPDAISFLGEPYDYNSATHFGLEDYAVSPGSTTMTILAPNQRIGQNNGLSEVDVRRINKAYRCGALVSGNTLCPDNWISALDGKCYYYSFLDPKAESVEGPARKACEPMLAVPLVISELLQPGRTLMLEIMRHAQVLNGVWVIGSSPMGDLLAERDGLCSTFDIEGTVTPTGVPCESSRRHYICQRTAANECWYVRRNTFMPYPDCSRLSWQNFIN